VPEAVSPAVHGYATADATRRYADERGAALPRSHYSVVPGSDLRLSSLGIGSYPGEASDALDETVADIVSGALRGGINVIDTAAHYRYGRSMRAVGEGLRQAFAAGISREAVFVIGKGGFFRFDDGPPSDPAEWFARHIAPQGLATLDDVTGMHCLAPGYMARQIDELRAATDLATLDAFLIDQPEIHVPRLGKEAMHRRLQTAFAVCEQAVRQGKIRCYGISSFDAFRVETDHALFQSITSLQALAAKAAQLVHQSSTVPSSLRMIELPFNQAMTEAFTRFGQATGNGSVTSTLQAAHQLGVFVVGSHGMAKGMLASQCIDALRVITPALANDAQRSLQFNRSTPGLGVSLTGMTESAQLADLLAVAKLPPLKREQYLGLFERQY
jgi:aryl-alcohol dehydrogenase-like predicted oxidoreductase